MDESQKGAATGPIKPASGEEHILDKTGHVHLTDAPIDLSVSG